ncbi:chromatin assembly factor 1 subunit A [Eupeodes corollae]|uniref:chromatin assembly factor 1 subunit A n=1 Tax=Eupeodes corollae TaxID=290404 RepID=UPI0024915872|nr:chromatin assembly factor 1 subunit A [Eupeodes corollae]
MKTIQSEGGQKAIMKSARKSNKVTTPSTERQRNEKESSTGKKLVQARLPFKIIAGTLPIKSQEDAASSAIEIPTKKRKLSFTEELENQKKIGKSHSKENLTALDKLDPSSVDVIVLDDESSEEETPPSVSKSPKTPISSGTASQKKKNKGTPNNGSSTTPKLQIKLPLSGKKKRKSKRISHPTTQTEGGSDLSDVELVSEEQDQNPPKKLKREEVSKQEVEDLSSGEVDDVNQKTDTNTGKCNSSHQKEIISKETKSPSESVLQTPKTSKSTKKTESTEGESCETDTPQPSDSIRVSKRSNKSKTPQKVENSEKSRDNQMNNSQQKALQKTRSDKKDESLTQKATNQDPPNGSSVKENSASPKKETRPSRRSIRISETDNNKKEDEGVSSEPEFVSETLTAADTSLNKSQNKLLTPKQQKLMEQRKKAREEKELKLQQLKEEKERKLQEQREERERKVQEEKIQKQKEREERELQRKREREEKEEQKRREREEKEDARRKEKEDKERKRLAEIEAKNEEKRKKDEAKEEERRKKDEDRRRKELEKEEEENKKKKAAQAFTKFFVPKPVKPITDEDQESREDAESVDSLAFRPFQVKGDMKLAPLVRREFKERSREKLDSFLKNTLTDKSRLYVGELKSGAHTPLRGFKTALKNNEEYEDDVVIIATELENAAQTIDEPRTMPIQTYKAKYYFFRENRRPPFYGTWRKKSTVITPRRPFATDKAFFDYEVDSDDEWEEEEPGESLNGSEDEKDESEDDDYEVDNEWFVPHGHLSDEEIQNEDELGPDTSREAQKAKLKALQQEFAQEMKKKTEKIKPRLIGAIWEDKNGNRPKLCPTIIWDSLSTRAMIFCEPPLVEAPEVPEPEPSTPPPEKQKRIEIKDDLLKDLARLVHGNRHSRVFLIKEYMEHVANTCERIQNGECLAPTKSQIKEKIDEISEWSVVDAVNKKKKNKKKLCWVVAADVLDKYSLGNLSLRNEWTYKLQPKFDQDKAGQNAVNDTDDESLKQDTSEHSKTAKSEKKKPKPAGITKFTKVITKEVKPNKNTDSESASPKTISKSSPKVSKNTPSPKVKEAKKAVIPAFKKPAPPAPSVTNKEPIVKKRVALLMSVPPGQQFSPQSKNALISKFLQNNKTGASAAAKSKEGQKSSKVPSSVTTMDVDEVVLLD